MTIKPILPKTDDHINILGIDAQVTAVTPQTDWTWRIDLASTNALGANEDWHIVIPTDFRTEDGFPIEDGGNAFTFRDDCGLCGEDATLDDYAEFTGPDGQRMMAHASCAAEHNFTQS